MALFRRTRGPEPPGSPGTEVGGYRIEGVLRRGEMGVVYRAEHKHLGRPVALKLLAPGRDGDFRARFVRESRIAASLSHRNIVAVYDAGEADGLLWIAMQLVSGTDLRQVLCDGPLSPEDAASVALQLASALDEAHMAGLVHRNVRPASILLQGDHAYLTDFGLSTVGSADYAAPEQLNGAVVTGAADQYALARVIREALRGAPPLPAVVAEVFARALADRPEERYPSAGVFAEALGTALGMRGTGPARGYVMVGVREATTRALIRAALDSGHAEIDEVGDADALLSHADAAAPGLVLLDVTLPGRSVDEVVRELRHAANDRIPVVALADRGREEQWRTALAAGADDVLLRPFSAFQLLAKVRDHMPRALEH